MPVATFDTLKFSKALREAGVSEKQADAEAGVLAEVFSLNFREVTTKDDLKAQDERNDYKRKESEQRLDAKINAVEQRLEAKIDALEQRLTAKIDQLEAKMDRTTAKYNGEFVLMRWMMGLSITLSVGIAIRLFLFGIR